MLQPTDGALQDSYGNATARGIDPDLYPILDVVRALPDDTYEPIHDLRATYHQVLALRNLLPAEQCLAVSVM